MEKQHMGPSFSTIPSEAVPNSVAIHMARPLAHCQCLKVETAHQGPIGNSEKNRISNLLLERCEFPYMCFCIVPSTLVVYSELGACADYYYSLIGWVFSIELWATSGIRGSRYHKFRISISWYFYMLKPRGYAAGQAGHVGQNYFGRPIAIRWLRMKKNLAILEY